MNSDGPKDDSRGRGYHSLRAVPRQRTGLTPYARWGNLLALLIAAGACLAALRK